MSVLQAHPVGPGRQSHTEYVMVISCIFEATFYSALQSKSVAVVYHPLIQLEGLGERYKLP